MLSKIKKFGDDQLLDLLGQPERLRGLIDRIETSRLLCVLSLAAVVTLLVIMIATVKATESALNTYSYVLVNIVILLLLLVYTDLYVKILKTGHRSYEISAASTQLEAGVRKDLSASEILNCYAVGVVAVILGALSYFMLLTL